jgi:hypothetical protein
VPPSRRLQRLPGQTESQARGSLSACLTSCSHPPGLRGYIGPCLKGSLEIEVLLISEDALLDFIRRGVVSADKRLSRLESEG